MITLADLRPGDIIFGPIGGIVPGMFPVGAGQLLLADRKARLTWKRWRKIRHVLVVTQAARQLAAEPWTASTLAAPKAVQAMPRGAEEIELTAARHWTSEYVIVRPLLDNSQGVEIATAARRYVDTPYNFLTYGKLAASRLGFVLTAALLRRWISTRRDMMCSQLADQCLADAGFHVFDDGRLPQDVVPAELYLALIDMPGTQWLVPGGEWQKTMNGPGVQAS